MRKKLFFVSIVTGAMSVGQFALARDIQLRPSNDSNAGSAQTAQQSATTTTDTQSLTIEQRVTRLERILNSQGLQEMLTRMDTLQSEVEKLRGDLEVQKHQLDELKQRQRDLYVDIDRRLTRLERNGSGSASSGGAKGVAGMSAAGAGKTGGAPKPTPMASSASTSAAPVDSAGEQKAYQKAFDTLRELRYGQAVKAFRSFLAKYPKGRYAHIAQYWIAEAEYAQRKFKQAITDYQKLIDNYPDSPKLAEAMLKIGYSQYELNNNKDATTILKQLIKTYPGTTEAGQAQNLLQKIRLNQ